LQVETSDGFLISLQHIPHGKNGVADNTGPPVFLQHGLFQVFISTTMCLFASDCIMLQLQFLPYLDVSVDSGVFSFNYLYATTLNYNISLHFQILCLIQILDREETHGSLILLNSRLDISLLIMALMFGLAMFVEHAGVKAIQL
jgi:hypothetical protein